ncbi:carboxypeptidase regulatory-like domain-containing protein [Flagellimonas aequoris]|uniref:Carboxypeptidase regulatory-like domain-containing protein n=2 Tax=Flagellimonas aequoris TaxID=2306997 RepID=A0A418N7X9_9FLAO|nr:carboxypeptidase regulatory-like domain-containing protein [Allomuricauda aequoris]TXK02265.1 carboxypeptidase regulatory-like domain-containing protein [Allomuricauda aequoris]
MIRYFLLVGILFFNLTNSFGQNIVLSGMVKDTTSATPLVNTNILAFPQNPDESTRFAISNEKGEYVLRLEKDVAYTIEVSYLGYQKLVFEYTATQDETKDLALVPKANDLEEVVLEYKIPIEVKEDTITYQTDVFVTGEERKLREVLKKLPGIEVDREGNVTAQGKKVTKVLVEDKTFFTGNSKLAVNNIPADAVDQVQVLDNYNKIGFLKGLQDSDEVALNIKLKEDKKKFAFGDMEVGGGIKDRYLVHPNIFYYSPKTNLNFIGDLNNVGIKSFTLTDYLEFNGGFGKLIGDIGAYLSLSNDDFSQFLSNTDFKANTNRFGALNIRQSVTSKMDINSYAIVNGSTTVTETNYLNTYINSDGSFDEGRNVTNDYDNFFLIGKFTVEHEPNSKEQLSANTFVKLTENKGEGSILTQSFDQSNFFNTVSNISALDLKQNLEYNKRFSRAQTFSMEATVAHLKNTPDKDWETNDAFLFGLIPLEEDTMYKVLQQKQTHTTSFDLVLKDYWVLNNYNHIYTSIGTSLSFEDFKVQEAQQLSNGTINDFSENGFGNDIDHRFNDSFLGLEYKFLTGIFTVKSGLFYHQYNWDNDQKGVSIQNNIQVLLPTFNAEAEFNNSEKLRFQYRQRMRFPNMGQLAANFMLGSFNSVILGNPELQNERIHSYSLNYFKYSLFRGLNLNAGITYNRKSQGIKNTTVLDGIDQFVTYTIFNQPENGFTANFNFGKKINKIKLGLESRGSYNEFYQLVNNNVSKNLSRSISLTGKMETFFINWPNVELGYTHQPSIYRTVNTRNTFTNTRFSAQINYVFLKDFHFKGDFERTEYKNEDQNLTNIFNVAGASLFYQKENSPWGFEISTSNLFDVSYKRQNSFSDFLISDQSTLIMPRIAMFKIVYKL